MSFVFWCLERDRAYQGFTKDCPPSFVNIGYTCSAVWGSPVCPRGCSWLRWPRVVAKSTAGKTTRLGRLFLQGCRTSRGGGGTGEPLHCVPRATAVVTTDYYSPFPFPPPPFAHPQRMLQSACASSCRGRSRNEPFSNF